MKYDYRCPKCGIVVEIERSIYAESDSPMCSGHCMVMMERMWSSPPVKFNATGFYSTGG